jgi:hypothetical protein
MAFQRGASAIIAAKSCEACLAGHHQGCVVQAAIDEVDPWEPWSPGIWPDQCWCFRSNRDEHPEDVFGDDEGPSSGFGTPSVNPLALLIEQIAHELPGAVIPDPREFARILAERASKTWQEQQERDTRTEVRTWLEEGAQQCQNQTG